MEEVTPLRRHLDPLPAPGSRVPEGVSGPEDPAALGRQIPGGHSAQVGPSRPGGLKLRTGGSMPAHSPWCPSPSRGQRAGILGQAGVLGQITLHYCPAEALISGNLGLEKQVCQESGQGAGAQQGGLKSRKVQPARLEVEAKPEPWLHEAGPALRRPQAWPWRVCGWGHTLLPPSTNVQRGHGSCDPQGGPRNTLLLEGRPLGPSQPPCTRAKSLQSCLPL